LIGRAAEREHIKSATLPDANLVLHLRKYTAHGNLPKKRKRNRIPASRVRRRQSV
jgi:hypothetical protein